jgi:aquaporin Z
LKKKGSLVAEVRNPGVDVADTVDAAPSLTKRLIAELFGTFVLVFGVIGTALFMAPAIGAFSVAFAVGLTIIGAAYAVGHISGGHFNPAVSIGAAASGRFAWRDVGPYAIAQILGGALATLVLFGIAAGKEGFLAEAQANGFASNGYAEHSPGGFGLLAVILTEVVITALFVWIILGVTDRRAPSGFAPIAIGLSLTLFHLVAIPISNASLNPARSIATAIFGGGDALAQLWVFILAPIVGALIAGFLYRPLFDRR